jgi:hypothetical protein
MRKNTFRKCKSQNRLISGSLDWSGGNKKGGSKDLDSSSRTEVLEGLVHSI